MICFTKADKSKEFFRLNFSRFLAGEGNSVTIQTIDSFTVVTGDVAIGTGAQAPAITNNGTAIDVWFDGGTAESKTLIEFNMTLTNGEKFTGDICVSVTRSSF